MKFNLKTAAFTVAALACLTAPLAISQVAHAGPGGGGRMARMIERLDLTETQAEQVEAIHDQAHAQMEAVLTQEQQTALENSDARGRRAWRQLDLSEDQREQLRAIRESAKEEVRALLTAEQQAALDEMREQRGQRRGQGGGRRSDRNAEN